METRGAAPAVQQYFAKQDRHVDSRISRWSERRERAETASKPFETLWAIDKGPDDKARTELLAHVRNSAKVAPLAAPKAVPPTTSQPASIAKMTALLEVVASGKSEAAGFYMGYWQALSKSLEELNNDAADAEASPPGGGSNATGGRE